MFSFHPAEAYLLGATPRIVPNDSLDRIAEYGRRTHTRWLLFRLSNTTEREQWLYQHAPWIQAPELLASNHNFIPRCGSQVLGAVLFEISGVSNNANPGAGGPGQ